LLFIIYIAQIATTFNGGYKLNIDDFKKSAMRWESLFMMRKTQILKDYLQGKYLFNQIKTIIKRFEKWCSFEIRAYEKKANQSD